MIRKLFTLGIAAVLTLQAKAVSGPSPDEGMWLPMYIKQYNEKDAQRLGLKLTADDIYNINRASVKDAIVQMGAFCTAEIVSPEALVFTNHHCGYDAIAESSTIEHDYLKDGFWAKDKKQEIPIKGLTMSRLVYMTNVTDLYKATDNISDATAKQKRRRTIQDSLVKAATNGNHYTARVANYFEGNEQYLLVYEVFKDIRLVGAPPSAVGKFGGDVDNWMWPRHTGDFSVFRIYAGKDNKPADYSAENVPYKPLHYLPISLKGVKQDDFAMIMGFPGSTERYLTSSEVAFARDYNNPAFIDAMGVAMDIMKKDMDADRKLALALASDYASGMNTYKYFIGQQRLLEMKDLVGLKKKEEEKFQTWANADPKRKEKYGNLLSEIEQLQIQKRGIEPINNYLIVGLFRGPVPQAYRYYPLNQVAMARAAEKKKISRADIDSFLKATQVSILPYLSSPGFNTDKKILTAGLIRLYEKVPENQRPEFLKEIVSKNKGANYQESITNYVNKMYEKSFLLDSVKYVKWASKPDYAKLEKDPLYDLTSDILGHYFTVIVPTLQTVNTGMGKASKSYMAGQREFRSDKNFYPDANSTMRFTYGKVTPYVPRDGAFYKYYTTHYGILEKSDDKDPDFATPHRMLELLRNKQFGGYAKNDTLVVNFITNNDITGGNSGSPVLDAEGNLIGLAFDGNWEAMLGDLYVDPNVNRTIVADARYVLWVIDVYAGAKNLINELKIVR